MKLHMIGAIIVLSIVLGACAFWGGANTEGYNELDSTLSVTEKSKKDLFDAGATYVVMQEVLKQAVLNSAVGEDFKSGVRTVDNEVVIALKNYRENLDISPDVLSAQLMSILQALQRAQLLVVQYATAQTATNIAIHVLPQEDLGYQLLKTAELAALAKDWVAYNIAMRAYEGYILAVKESLE